MESLNLRLSWTGNLLEKQTQKSNQPSVLWMTMIQFCMDISGLHRAIYFFLFFFLNFMLTHTMLPTNIILSILAHDLLWDASQNCRALLQFQIHCRIDQSPNAIPATGKDTQEIVNERRKESFSFWGKFLKTFKWQSLERVYKIIRTWFAPT